MVGRGNRRTARPTVCILGSHRGQHMRLSLTCIFPLPIWSSATSLAAASAASRARSSASAASCLIKYVNITYASILQIHSIIYIYIYTYVYIYMYTHLICLNIRIIYIYIYVYTHTYYITNTSSPPCAGRRSASPAAPRRPAAASGRPRNDNTNDTY